MLSELADALGRPENTFRFLDLEKTDVLQSEISAAIQAIEGGTQSARHRRWPEPNSDDVDSLLARFAQHVPDEPVYMFRLLSQYCGAVESNITEVLSHWPRLVSRNQEHLLVAPCGANKGLRLELWAEGPGSDQNYTFDLLVWGGDWLSALSLGERASLD